MTGFGHKFASSGHELGLLRSVCSDGGTAPTSNLEEAFAAESFERSQQRVHVDVETCGQLVCWRQLLTGIEVTYGDRVAELTGELVVNGLR